MNESVLPNSESHLYYTNSEADLAANYRVTPPFFSIRKLRVIYNELITSAEFDYATFDSFKQQVLNSVAPQLELNKWQAIAARR